MRKIYAGVLGDCKGNLNDLAREIELNSTAEIAIVTIETLGEENLEEYANGLFRDAGIGKKDKNNGLLILAVINDRKFRVETGYGLEGDLPDALLYSITQKNLVPNFKNGDYCEGIRSTVSEIGKILSGEKEVKDVPEIQLGVIVSLLIGFLILLFIFGSNHKTGYKPTNYRHTYTGSSYFTNKCPNCGRKLVNGKCQKCDKDEDKDRHYHTYSSGDSDSGFGGFGGGSSGGGGVSGGW